MHRADRSTGPDLPLMSLPKTDPITRMISGPRCQLLLRSGGMQPSTRHLPPPTMLQHFEKLRKVFRMAIARWPAVRQSSRSSNAQNGSRRWGSRMPDCWSSVLSRGRSLLGSRCPS